VRCARREQDRVVDVRVVAASAEVGVLPANDGAAVRGR
jgi:hypothetical protein